MSNNLKIGIVVIIIILLGVFVYYQKPKSPVVNENSILGCYVVRLSQDIHSLKITSQNEEGVEGTLAFKNFEKDSSSGTFKGTYKNGILLGDYSFQSEGTNSVMQVIFKKSGNGFVRGYGDIDSTGTRFADINKITYDSSPVFETSTKCTTAN